MFEKGDRVRCVKGYMHGTKPGDTGTVLKEECGFLYVRWDEFSTSRHRCGGLCENGHGWNVPETSVVRERLDVDLGELPVLNIADIL